MAATASAYGSRNGMYRRSLKAAARRGVASAAAHLNELAKVSSMRRLASAYGDIPGQSKKA